MIFVQLLDIKKSVKICRILEYVNVKDAGQERVGSLNNDDCSAVRLESKHRNGSDPNNGKQGLQSHASF